MRPRKRTGRGKRGKAPSHLPIGDKQAWNRLVETLAMHLCPAEEWQAYEKKVQYQVWQSQQKKDGVIGKAKICVFPVWRKYRQQARKIASLHQVVPILRHLPLPVSSFLGKVFF